MSRSLVCIVVGVAACNSASGKTSGPPAAAPVAARVAPPAPAPAPADAGDYVPAEFKTGAARWKDTGVYLDGKPVGFLSFGELPITLKPTWVKEKRSANKRYGTDDPGWEWTQERFYKFTDYLRAIGVEPRRIREIHVLGPKPSDSIVATGRDLMTPAADELLFRFGASVSGKPLPHVPARFGNGRSPDKINAVMIYINKTPPVIVPNEGLALDGRLIDGVPYYGEPIRGGVRVYLDDRLATIIKRQDLDMKAAAIDGDGAHWGLWPFLAARGVDTSHVVEGWAIADERRTQKLGAAELAGMTFSASAQAKGVIVLGAAKIRANVIALHTRAIAPGELPVILPDEE
jgi:hypothetical protein